MRGLRHFKVRGKHAPRFIEPFKILEKRGEVLTNWSYRHSCLMCMTCSISLN
jgi:hypothetical protein